jgi:Golgi phosphoprotein 3
LPAIPLPRSLRFAEAQGMLSFVEEIVLLLHDDASGEFVQLPQSVFSVVIAGAALMDLAIHNRIDTDLESLTVVDRIPLGDDILDDVLATIVTAAKKVAGAGPFDISTALYDVAADAELYRARALGRLIQRGILREENGRHLWVFRSRRYPIIDDAEQQEVRARLRHILLSDEIPDPRDIVLICLASACSLLRFILSPDEIDDTAARVDQLRKMDLIGQAVIKAAAETDAIIRFAATTI